MRFFVDGVASAEPELGRVSKIDPGRIFGEIVSIFPVQRVDVEERRHSGMGQTPLFPP